MALIGCPMAWDNSERPFFLASRKGSWCSFVRHYPTEKTREKFRAVRLNSSMTATRSPLNNRVVRSTPGEAEGRTTTLKGSPYTAAGALFQSAFVVFLLPQVLRTLRLLSEDAFSVISTAQVEKFCLHCLHYAYTVYYPVNQKLI